MDTDDLSVEAYKAVILESGKFHADLILQFGLLAEDCNDEGEFLAASREKDFRDEET
jgi:hypothetical protein